VIRVLEVRDVPRPVPGAGEVLVEVQTAGIDIGKGGAPEWSVHDLWPLTRAASGPTRHGRR